MGGGKDADMSPFEAGRKLLSLESEKMSLNDRIDLVFQDADLVPLLVQVITFCCLLMLLQRTSCSWRELMFQGRECCCEQLVLVLCRKTMSTTSRRLPIVRSPA